jgi:hypothetical protein
MVPSGWNWHLTRKVTLILVGRAAGLTGMRRS